MTQEKATRIELFKLNTHSMRAFHVTWAAFFLCFFGWFGVAPLMPVIREDLGLSKHQIGNIIIASVAVTVLVRLLIGPLLDRYGPRRVYSILLILGSIPVMGIGLADSYASFLVFRLAIGAIGASFVITQYHMSVMFAPNVVGTANAVTAGWGNLGGGVTQMLMPLIFAALVSLGVEASMGWRLAMVVPGVLLLLSGFAYARLTQDTPNGNFEDLRASGQLPTSKGGGAGGFREAMADYRTWILALAYAVCFGIELTIHNTAALYYHDRFGLDLRTAGMVAGIFGLLCLFARAVGGIVSDRVGRSGGLDGRVRWLFAVVFFEGLFLVLFSRMDALFPAVIAMSLFGLFTHFSTGATYGVVPFINRHALGSVAGIVGAGGNVGAVLSGMLFGMESVSSQDAFLYLGVATMVLALPCLAIRFPKDTHEAEMSAVQEALARNKALATAAMPPA